MNDEQELGDFELTLTKEDISKIKAFDVNKPELASAFLDKRRRQEYYKQAIAAENKQAYMGLSLEELDGLMGEIIKNPCIIFHVYFVVNECTKVWK